MSTPRNDGRGISYGLLAMTVGLVIGAWLLVISWQVVANAEPEHLTMDLKGIETQELFRILSLKMGITIVPTKNVAGRVNVFLNNLTFDDALDVILISQDLACEKKGAIVNVMTAAEYQALYGEKYNEKRKFKSVKLTYAKPATVLAALGQLKSEIGKVIVDEASGTVFLIDIPEKLELMEQKVSQLDRPLETDIFYLKFAKAEDIKERLSGSVTPGVGEIIVDSRLNKVMVSDLSQKLKKIKRLMKHFDKEGRQVFLDIEVIDIVLKDEYQKAVNWEALIKYKAQPSELNFRGVFPVSLTFTPSPTLSSDNVQFTAGTLGKDGFTATLQFLKTLGDTRVIAHEYLSVAEKGEAKLTVASREPIVMQELNSLEASTITADKVEFVDVGLKVAVQPEFNEDDVVTLNITANSNTLRSITTSDKSYVTNVDKIEANTSVKVESGTTLMVAGLHTCDIQRLSASLPALTKTPLSGTDAYRIKNREALIFVTPYFYGKRWIKPCKR